MEKVYNTICEDCGTVFKAKSKRAFLCPKCVKRRISESHKNKNNPKFNKHTEREVVIWQDRRRKQKIKPSDRA